MQILIVLIIVGVLYLSSEGSTMIPAGKNGEGVGPECGGIGGFIKGHVDRKNKLAPTVIEKYTGGKVGGGTAKGIADLADKFSISNKAEKFIGDKVGDFLCNNDPLQAAADGAKFIGEKIADAAGAVASGAEYVGGKIVQGGKAVGQFGVGLVKNPLSGVQSLNSIAGKTAGTSLSLSSRAAGAVYNSLPTPLKIAAAPAYAVQKVTSKITTTTTKAAGAVVSTVAGGLASGTKAATSAVSSGVSKVLGFL